MVVTVLRYISSDYDENMMAEGWENSLKPLKKGLEAQTLYTAYFCPFRLEQGS